MRVPLSVREWSKEHKRCFFAAQDWVYVREYWRSRPYMAWSNVKDVRVREYIRRPPYWHDRKRL